MRYLVLFLYLFLFTCVNAFANTAGVASVVKFKGEIQFENPDTGEKGVLTEGMWLKEKVIIRSSPKSFARLLFIDKSTMTVGPNSEVEIKQFPKSEAGVINLLKGKIRSEVTKNYLEMKDKDSSKLYITTKTAAMGVRGTDFQVTYNDVNHSTGLITYSGAVAMNRFRENFSAQNMINTRELETIVRAPEAVLVVKGQFSKASEQDDKPIAPLKVAPAQLYQMKKDGELEKEMGGKSAERSLIPPGVNSKEIINDASGLDQEVRSVAGGTAPAPVSALPPMMDKPVIVVSENNLPTPVLPVVGALPPPPLASAPLPPPPPLPPELAPDGLPEGLPEIKPILPTLGNVKIIINLQ